MKVKPIAIEFTDAGNIIGSFEFSQDRMSYPEMKDYANKFAAAPEMYEALKLLEVFGKNPANRGGKTLDQSCIIMDTVISVASTAIRKAEGRGRDALANPQRPGECPPQPKAGR